MGEARSPGFPVTTGVMAPHLRGVHACTGTHVYARTHTRAHMCTYHAHVCACKDKALDEHTPNF